MSPLAGIETDVSSYIGANAGGYVSGAAGGSVDGRLGTTQGQGIRAASTSSGQATDGGSTQSQSAGFRSSWEAQLASIDSSLSTHQEEALDQGGTSTVQSMLNRTNSLAGATTEDALSLRTVSTSTPAALFGGLIDGQSSVQMTQSTTSATTTPPSQVSSNGRSDGSLGAIEDALQPGSAKPASAAAELDKTESSGEASGHSSGTKRRPATKDTDAPLSPDSSVAAAALTLPAAVAVSTSQSNDKSVSAETISSTLAQVSASSQSLASSRAAGQAASNPLDQFASDRLATAPSETATAPVETVEQLRNNQEGLSPSATGVAPDVMAETVADRSTAATASVASIPQEAALLSSSETLPEVGDRGTAVADATAHSAAAQDVDSSKLQAPATAVAGVPQSTVSLPSAQPDAGLQSVTPTRLDRTPSARMSENANQSRVGAETAASGTQVVAHQQTGSGIAVDGESSSTDQPSTGPSAATPIELRVATDFDRGGTLAGPAALQQVPAADDQSSNPSSSVALNAAANDATSATTPVPALNRQTASVERISEATASRSPRKTESDGKAQSADLSTQTLDLNSARDSLFVARVEGTAQAADSATNHASGGSSSSPTATVDASSQGSTFAALDSAAPTVSSHWTSAGPQRAEAGYQDPSLGWVGVRAESAHGQVHATVMPGSTDAAQVLGGHMAGLHAYLAGEHSSVQTVTLATPEGREASFANTSNHDMNQNMSQNSGQNSGFQPPATSMPDLSGGIVSTSPVSAASAANSTQTATPAEGSGAYISVMA
jgi:hypothetical protein